MEQDYVTVALCIVWLECWGVKVNKKSPASRPEIQRMLPPGRARTYERTDNPKIQCLRAHSLDGRMHKKSIAYQTITRDCLQDNCPADNPADKNTTSAGNTNTNRTVTSTGNKRLL